jgi:hypothetical protein
LIKLLIIYSSVTRLNNYSKKEISYRLYRFQNNIAGELLGSVEQSINHDKKDFLKDSTFGSSAVGPT